MGRSPGARRRSGSSCGKPGTQTAGRDMSLTMSYRSSAADRIRQRTCNGTVELWEEAVTRADNSPLTIHGPRPAKSFPLRSEEHTSELQSQSNLVCRLLLEKKKK